MTVHDFMIFEEGELGTGKGYGEQRVALDLRKITHFVFIGEDIAGIFFPGIGYSVDSEEKQVLLKKWLQEHLYE